MRYQHYLASGLTFFLLTLPVFSSGYTAQYNRENSHKTLRTNLILVDAVPGYANIQGAYHIDEQTGFENEYQLNKLHHPRNSGYEIESPVEDSILNRLKF